MLVFGGIITGLVTGLTNGRVVHSILGILNMETTMVGENMYDITGRCMKENTKMTKKKDLEL